MVNIAICGYKTNAYWCLVYLVLIPEAGLSLRGLFVIDPQQKLRVAHIHDLPIGRSVDETLRVIEAIKFTDEHGEASIRL